MEIILIRSGKSGRINRRKKSSNNLPWCIPSGRFRQLIPDS